MQQKKIENKSTVWKLKLYNVPKDWKFSAKFFLDVFVCWVVFFCKVLGELKTMEELPY